jgi:hypothetical protein
LKSGLPVSSVAQGSHLQLTDAISFQLPEAKVGVRFFLRHEKKKYFFCRGFVEWQGGQIGRILAHWVILYFGMLFFYV